MYFNTIINLLRVEMFTNEENSERFVKNVNKMFNYLIEEYEFKLQFYKQNKQENDTILRDTFSYISKDKRIKIIILNAYHPVDYRFEIIIEKNNSTEMLYYKLKEEQNITHDYLNEAVVVLIEYLDKIN